MTNPQPNASDIANADRAEREGASSIRAAMYARLEAEKRVAKLEKLLRRVVLETRGRPVGAGDGQTYVVGPPSAQLHNDIVAALRSEQPK